MTIHAGPRTEGEEPSFPDVSALTARTIDIAGSRNWRVRIEPLYGPEGSTVYALVTRDDRTEVREIVAAARRASGPILELAAGAGRLTLPLLALGRRVTAVDSSPTMLDLLERSVGTRPAGRLTAVQADMTEIVERGAFGTIVLGATSITLLDPDGRQALYGAVAAEAAPDARFLVTVAEDGAPAREDPSAGRTTGPVLSSEIRGDRRLVNVLVPPETDGAAATVLTSSVTLLDRRTLMTELVARGFDLADEVAVRRRSGAPSGVVLLEWACPPQ